VNEARLEQTGGGLVPAEEGWFVMNVRDAFWATSERFGAVCMFDGPQELFSQVGYRIRVLQPGQPNGMYHHESNQEDFLVLAGECLLLVEGEERRLRPWDFFHAPPWTEHAFAGAGEGPCVILMAGSRTSPDVRYPASELAARHGASVAESTSDWRQAYATLERFRRARPPGWARLPWA
jgi:uncharacterized cupin superfamily protein